MNAFGPYQNEKEFLSLLRLCKREGAVNGVIEIGSLHGHTLLPWMILTDGDNPVVSIDRLIPRSDPRYEEQLRGHNETWEQWAIGLGIEFWGIWEDSREVTTLEAVRRALGTRKVSVLFIDGGHDLATIRSDYLGYRRFVHPGGLIAFHDIARNHPQSEGYQAWKEVLTDGPDVEEKSWEFVYEENYREFGIGVIRKKDPDNR
jgi:hypothetical protein